MALINKLTNVSSVTFGGVPINSNSVETLLTLAPTLLKTTDKTVASVGDTLAYTTAINNASLAPLTNLPFTDVLPVGCTYLTDTFKVAGTKVTPTVTNNTITYTIPVVPAAGSVLVEMQAKIVGGNV